MSLCGIDEAGRGPLAGPLVVAGVVLLTPIDGLEDSKKLSEKKREQLFEKIVANSTYKIVFCDNHMIDLKGISWCIRYALLEIMQNVVAEEYLFDGNTSYNVPNLKHQVKADASVHAVSAASILAKVSRDRHMDALASKYPEYDLQKHKGYGTVAHIQAIRRYGYSDIHRKSFQVKQLCLEPTLNLYP